MNKLFICLILLAFINFKSNATHIVGGVLSYQCLGINTNNNTITLRITLRVYRDAINGQAPFDDPAIVGVFAGTNTTALQIMELSNPVITNAPIVFNDPCLSVTPGSVAVEEAVYSEIIVLPINSAGYTFAYQRCCRNQTINNLVNPGAVGATYSIFLTGAAQTACNSSPVFNNYPPIVICKDQPINFDHAATDQNGNTLVYSLCDPTTGGSQVVPAPNPPDAPPYTFVPFSAGFNATFPMPSNPVISIDPNTGLLSGTPRQTGQFVVGVCVQEFSPSGVLLSTTMRDFQFNVVNCFSTLDAAIQADSVDANGQSYVVNICDNNVITFINQSTAIPQSLITAYEWRFDLNNGNFAISAQTNPTITFPGPGRYSGWLVANPGQTGCSDTAFITLNVFPPVLVRFNIFIDSCNLNLPPIQFTDNSISNPLAPIISRVWNFGDGTSSTLQNPQHSYTSPGNYNVTLTLTDINGCVNDTVVPVSWFPPALPQYTVNDPNGCEPHTAIFTHTSSPFANGYTTRWLFGDGDSSNLSPAVTHSYPNPGTYTVSLQHISPWGCVSNLTRNNLITVFESPDADYSYTYDSCEYAPVFFSDQSIPNSQGNPIVSWLWDFEDGTTSNQQNPSHLYQLAGTYPVSLTITDINGCSSSVSDSIYWYPKPVIDVQIQSNQGCAPFVIFFDNQSYPINGYTTVWNFGDGNTSNLPSPTHSYINDGIYFVNLVITSPLGCRDTFRDTIEVFEIPNTNFSFNFDLCEIEPVVFDEFSTPNSNGTPLVNFTWEFGDGNSLNAQDTSHLYNLAGDFNVRLIVTDANQCSDTSIQLVRWHPAPIIAVNVSDSVGCQPLTVNFTNNSYPINGYTTTWDFGDGGSSAAPGPTHTYNQHGNFLVHLSILSPTGCTGDFFDTIKVNQIPNADFRFSYDSCSFGGAHIYDLSSTNQAGIPILNWNWDYDSTFNANVNYSIADTIIPYSPRNSYDISLIVTDQNGCRDTVEKTINYFPAPVFPVQNHNVEACIDLTVNFTNNPLNNFPGYTFVRNFGNGQISNSFDTSYIYNTEGIYIATLTVNTASGCVGIFKDTIVANGTPKAIFNISYDSCEIGDVTFRSVSIPSRQGNITNTQWNFGDGTGSSLPLDYHQYNYADTGYFNISLSITDENGCGDDTVGQFYWRPLPVFPINLIDSRGCVPFQPVLFSNTPYPISGYSTIWNFGNNTGSSSANPAINYSIPGIYDVSLIVNSPIGCRDTFYANIEALEVPEAGFDFSPDQSEISIFNNQVEFTDTSKRANLWQWNFGDGTLFTGRNAAHVFRDTGLITVTQIVTHRNGCQDTAVLVLDIVPKFTYFLPNAFTPNNDGKNDIFMGAGHFEFIRNFEMSIFNRWGERIYENNSPYESWNGRKFNTGELCQAGVYIVVVRFEGPRGEIQEVKGFATIVY